MKNSNKVIENALLKAIKSQPDKIFELCELLKRAGISTYSMPAREVLLYMVEKRQIQMTPDYRFKA